MKHIFKKTAIVSMALVMLVGCGQKEATDGKKDGEIEVIAKGFTQQYWTAVKNGSEEAAKELGVTINFTGPANETAIQEQVQMLSNAVNKKPMAIALASLDTESQIDLLNQSKNAGIPIVGFDSGVPNAPEGSVFATAATNNKDAAAIAADKLFEALEDKLKTAKVGEPIRVAALSQEVNSQSISDRTEGFITRFEELASKLDNIGDQVAIVGNDKFNRGSESSAALILQVQVPADATDSKVQSAALALLNMSDLAAVFTSNETASKGLLNANESLGNVLGDDKILAAGFDSGKMQKEAVKNNTFIGSVTQDPIKIGHTAVTLAYKVAQGEKVEDVDVPAAWYNSENIDSTDIAPLLYD